MQHPFIIFIFFFLPTGAAFSLNFAETPHVDLSSPFLRHSSLIKSKSPPLNLQGTLGHNLEGCREMIRSSSSLGIVHQRISYECQGIPVFGVLTKKHFHGKRLMHRTDALPPSWRQKEKEPDSSWPRDIKEKKFKHRATAIWFPAEDSLLRAWVIREDTADGSDIVIISDRDQEELMRQKAGFHSKKTARLFIENRMEGSPQIVEMTSLDSSNFLNGKTFSVFPESGEEQDRLEASDHYFNVSPSETFHFEQAQVYANLERAASWFRDHLGFDWKNHHLIVKVGVVIDGLDPDNAAYYPPQDGVSRPEIHFGKGRDLRDLAIDSDVSIHELAHHVIYQFVDNRFGDAAMLHEGFADYFAYALNEDPYLGESVYPGRDYLRTALVDNDYRFDNPYLSMESHIRGQIWAAFLWQLREKIGPEADKIIMQSLNYLDGHSSVEEALAAILQSQIDLQLAKSQGEIENSHCIILKEAVHRGMAFMLKDINGADCGLDIDELSRHSEDKINGVETDTTGKKLPQIFGVSCGVVAGSEKNSIHWLFLALGCSGFFLRRRRIGNESNAAKA